MYKILIYHISDVIKNTTDIAWILTSVKTESTNESSNQSDETPILDKIPFTLVSFLSATMAAS